MVSNDNSSGVVAVGEQLPPLCSVEIPGRVADVDEAVASIGGRAAVGREMWRPDGRLQLRLCRKYDFQAPIPMHRRRTSDLLVRARRRSDGSWECSIIGVVNAVFAAEALADYIFAPGPEFAYGERTVASSIEAELSTERRTGHPYLPPAFFTRVDTPQPYEFEENRLVRKQTVEDFKGMAGTAEAQVIRSWVQVHVVRFHDAPPVPNCPPEGAEEQVRDDEVRLVSGMRELFAERPLWIRAPVEERLQERGFNTSVTSMQKAFQCVSYLWSDGPWRGCYARLGYDPRTERTEAGRMQVIDFRDRFFRQQRVYFAARQGRAANSSHMSTDAADCHFRRPPANRSQLYQFVDVEDEVVQNIIHTAEFLPQASERSGWLPQPALDAIRERMAVKAELMRRAIEVRPMLEAPSASAALTNTPEAKEADAVTGTHAATAPKKLTAPPHNTVTRGTRVAAQFKARRGSVIRAKAQAKGHRQARGHSGVEPLSRPVTAAAQEDAGAPHGGGATRLKRCAPEGEKARLASSPTQTAEPPPEEHASRELLGPPRARRLRTLPSDSDGC